MTLRTALASAGAIALIASPAVAMAGTKASSSVSSDVMLAMKSSQPKTTGASNNGKGSGKFPPGLVGKCGDPDFPGANGIARACANQSRGSN